MSRGKRRTLVVRHPVNGEEHEVYLIPSDYNKIMAALAIPEYHKKLGTWFHIRQGPTPQEVEHFRKVDLLPLEEPEHEHEPEHMLSGNTHRVRINRTDTAFFRRPTPKQERANVRPLALDPAPDYDEILGEHTNQAAAALKEALRQPLPEGSPPVKHPLQGVQTDCPQRRAHRNLYKFLKRVNARMLRDQYDFTRQVLGLRSDNEAQTGKLSDRQLQVVIDTLVLTPMEQWQPLRRALLELFEDDRLLDPPGYVQLNEV